MQYLLQYVANRVLENRSFNLYFQPSVSIEPKHDSNRRLNMETIQMTHSMSCWELAPYEWIRFESKMRVTEAKFGTSFSSHHATDIPVTFKIMSPVWKQMHQSHLFCLSLLWVLCKIISQWSVKNFKVYIFTYLVLNTWS